MTNQDVARVLNEIATLLDLSGESPFKGRAYVNVARQIESLEESIEDVVREKRLRGIKGVGDALESKIHELVTTGRLKYYENLREKFPPTLFQLLLIPGLGAKRIKQLHDDLGIDSLEKLEEACRGEQMKELRGFGPKMVEKILEGIGFARQHQGQYLFDKAYVAAEDLLDHLRGEKSIIRLEVAGSLRRRKEVIKDIDIIASSAKPKQVMEQFKSYPRVASVTGTGETKTSVVLDSGIAADLRVVADKEFPYALAYFTGSKEHNIVMRQRAKERGLKLNEYGLFEGETLVACKDEAAIFKKLGLPYIPPELREDMGEFALKKTPNLIEMDDVLGLIHCHSTYSDGHNTIRQMSEAAQSAGYQYMTMTDHSQTAAYANGLQPERVALQQREIDKLNKSLNGFWIVKGIESDILVNGALDYPEEILSTFEVVIASVHSQLEMTEAQATKRIVAAVMNPYTNILGHPTGRLLLKRDGFPLNLDAVFEACVENNVAIEINADCRRLDLDWRYVHRAKERGVKISIGPDAHRVEAINFVKYGVGIARKGWLEPADVVNCMALNRFLKWARKGRKN